MTAQVFDARPFDLGEGLLWHPLRAQLFWFEITGHRMLSRKKIGQAEHRVIAD